MKKITFQEISKEGVNSIGSIVEIMAECEGLDAHKNAMTMRINSLAD
jgi:histidinol dehydrogenase